MGPKEERSPRSSLRTSQSSADAARNAFPSSGGRRTMFFDKSPEAFGAWKLDARAVLEPIHRVAFQNQMRISLWAALGRPSF